MNLRGRSVASALVRTLAVLVLGLSARAEADEWHRFDPFVQKPSTSPLGLFTLEGAAAGDGLDWVAVRGDYAHGLLAFTDAKGNLLGNVIPDRVDTHLLVSAGWKNFLSLGVDVPFTAYQSDGFNTVRDILRKNGATEATALAFFPPVRSYGLGDIRLVPKIALPFHKPFSLAVVPEIRLRTGDDQDFLGDALGPIQGKAGPIFCPRLEAEGTVWRLRVVGELGYQARGAERFYNLEVGDQITFGAGASMALPKLEQLTSWEAIAEFNGNTQTAAPFTFAKANNFKTPLELVGGVRARFVHGIVALAGVGSGLSGGGYGRELFRAFAGVGWEPPGATSTVALPSSEEDRDHDGVPDKEDRCPDQPGSPETDGCPDKDGDGIPDIEDKCPDEPGPPENEGCPVEGPMVTYTPPKLTLRAGITFETGKAEIKPESFKVLDAVAAFLKEHGELKKLRIEGHTDNKGSAKLNLDLSKRRARSVLNYLVKHGVEADRLSSEGYGFERPIADNATALGRARNRRVDFTVLEPATGEGEPALKTSTPEAPKPAPAPGATPAPAPAPAPPAKP